MRVILEDIEVGQVIVIGLVEGPVEYDDPDPGEEDEPEEEHKLARVVGKVVNL